MTLLLQLQRFFVPALLVLLAWAIWRLVVRKDLAVGLVLYLGLVIVVDGFYNTGIYLPGLEAGSIRYSEVCAVFLLMYRPPASDGGNGASQYGLSRKDVPLALLGAAIASLVPRRMAHLVALYFVLLFLSTLHSNSIQAGIFEFRRIIVPQIVAFIVAKRGLSSPEEYRRFVWYLMTLAIIVGLFTFWDVFFDRWLLKSEMLFKPEYWVNRKQRRFGGMFLNPNFLGAFAVLIFPLLFVGALTERTPWRRLYALTALLALVFSLIETQSRGPLIAFAISLILLTLGPTGHLSRTRRAGFLALFLVLFGLFMPGFLEHASERFSSLEKETSATQRSRETVWDYTQDIIADHPFTGVGFGEQQFLSVMEAYGFREKYGEESLDNPHNSYLQISVYAGIPALAAFLWANILLLVRGARMSMRRVATESGPTGFSIAVGIAAFLACIYTDMHLFTPNVAPIYWVFFGLLLALTRASREPASA